MRASIRKYGKQIAISLLLAAAYLAWQQLSATGRWKSRPYTDLGIMVVDYTVPFDNYREHAGLFWLLNHRKIRAPAALQRTAAKDSNPEVWQLARDYIGYRPDDRDHPVRLSYVDRKPYQAIYVTDTYGVYKADLLHIDDRVSHMDYTPLVFGGLSDGDAHALAEFVTRGGLLMAEFNTFCDPTGEPARQLMQDVLGIDWREWVGRVFADPYDDTEVPHWLAREFKKQYPGQELPHSPILLLVRRDGHVLVLGGPSLMDVAPRLLMTAEGKKRFPHAPGDAPYYFWFSLMRPRPDARVYARFKLPNIEGVEQLLAEVDAGPMPPALVEHQRGAGRGLYFAGDFADVDFDPGPYDDDDAIPDGAHKLATLTGMTTAPAFWNFYAPVMDQLLREAAEAHEQHPSTLQVSKR